jgi:hypothetical protein
LLGSSGLDFLSLFRHGTITIISNSIQVMPLLRPLFASLSPQKPGFNTRPIHVGFVVDKLVVRQFFSECFHLPLSIWFHRCSTLIHSAITDGIISTFEFIKQLPKECPTQHNRPSEELLRILLGFASADGLPSRLKEPNPEVVVHNPQYLSNFLTILLNIISSSMH